MTNEQRERLLVHLLTDYDRRQSSKRGHNPYALGHYLGAVESVMRRVKAGDTWERALTEGFTQNSDGSFALAPIRAFVKQAGLGASAMNYALTRE